MSTPIERAAEVLMRLNADGLPEWRDLGDQERTYWRGEARAAIDAAADVDELAQEIRRVDGNHDMGAGALAEAIRAYLTKETP